jgi:putative ABC transport system permease protein
VLRWLLRIIDAGRWLAPPSRRRDWRRQWRADIWHEWDWLNRRARGRVAGRATLLARTLGALRHAWQLRLHVRQVEMISQDVRYGWRSLSRNPGFTAAAIATLAVGIGANTTIFSLMNAVVLRPLASRGADRVVRIVPRSGTGAAGASSRRFSYPEFVDYRTRTTSLETLAAVNLATYVLDADNRTDQLLGEIASGEYLSLLGARATHGRLLSASDDVAGAAPVAVISTPLWQRRFGGEPVVGRQVLLNRVSYTIVGVVEPSFVGSYVGAPIDLWASIATSGRVLGDRWEVDRSQREFSLIGRLRGGATRVQAQQDLQSIATAIARDFTPDLQPVIDVVPGTLIAGDQRRVAIVFLSLLLGLVGLVLVIAAANVGNMMLARVIGRKRELAIRVALGASSGQLARLLAVEGTLVAVGGGAGALLLAAWTARLFDNISPLPTLTLRLDLRLDTRVVMFTILAAAVAATILGLVGAFQAVRPAVAPALKEEAAAALGGRSPRRLRGALAAIQITVSLMLLIGAALFVRSLREAARIDLGFDPRGVVAMDVGAFTGRSAAESLQMFHSLLEETTRIPGATAAISTRAPLDSSTPIVSVNAGQAVETAGANASPSASFLIVSPGYFDVVRTPILIGRDFTQRDDASRTMVAIVNETLARRLWPRVDPIGHQLWMDAVASTAPCIVIGVTRNSKYVTLGEEGQGHVYLPFAQHPRRGMTLLMRSGEPAERVAASMQSALQRVDPQLQGFFTRTLDEHVAVSRLPVRIAAGVTAVVATLAIALAIVGLYSLVSFIVAERTHEIGLRMALGAANRDVLRLVLGYGMKLAAIGLAIGIPAALAASRLLRNLLYGVSATDPIVFAVGGAAVLAVCALASFVPAWRAMRLDPVVALKTIT